MLKNFRNFSLFVFILFASDLISQTINLEQLEQLEQLGDTFAADEVIEADDPDVKPLTQRVRVLKESDVEFGYQGSNDSFIVEPKPKKNPKIGHFGYDFFTNPPSTYATSRKLFVPQNYIIGQGDIVRIVLYGNRNNRYELEVSPEGNILIPGIGPIIASGLSFDNLQKLIGETVSTQYIGTNASITLGRLRSINIFVLGNAISPGMYTVSALTTMTNAIFTSGGIAESGSLRNIQLKRNGEIISTIDFYDLLLNGDTSGDISLQEGDVVFIPPITKTVAITGEIIRPYIYEVLENEHTVDLLNFAGGFKPSADNKSMEIERVDRETNSFRLIDLNLNNQNLNSFELENGDVINVYPVDSVMRNAILVKGHTQKPGFLPWKQGMKLNEVISSFDRLLPMTDLNYVLVKRALNDGTFNIIQIDLEMLFKDIRNNRESKQNLVFQERDEVIFFPKFLSPELISPELIPYEDLTPEQKQTLLLDTQTKEASINPLTGESEAGIDLGLSSPKQTTNNNIFYKYNIHHYCTLEADIGEGFYFDLETREGPSLTQICREQLMKPILNIVQMQSNSSSMNQVVSVNGSVFFPGQYPFVDNMTMQQAIDASGGLRDFSYTPDVELIRSNLSGKEYVISSTTTPINEGELILLKLQPNDIINIKKISRNIGTAEIYGEVFFPGQYPIYKKATLKSLILRAGNLNDKAFPKAAVFQRKSIADSERENFKQAQIEITRKLILASQSNSFGQQQADPEILKQIDLLLKPVSETSDSLGRLVIDIDGIMNGTQPDIELQDGDKLFIPRVQNTISVVGEVYVSNAHNFKKELSIQDYIDLSGGVTDYADPDKSYIIKADGSIIPSKNINTGGFFRSNSSTRSTLQPGDSIVVPLKVDSFSGLTATTEVTQVIYQLAVAAAAISSFGN